MSPVSSYPFVKMNGAGNDFILIDHRDPLFPLDMVPDMVRRVCRRKFGVGADGLVLIEHSDHADFKWRFFNADGSEAEMCGNCARCAARFAYMYGIAPARMRFETLAGIIEASVEKREVSVIMTPAHSLQLSREIDLPDSRITVHTVNTGVPHVVYFVDDARAVEVEQLGKTLRFHPVFLPAGTNVNFVSIEADGIVVRTYERGVEQETMACGTGAVAAALVACSLGKVAAPVKVITSGGSTLSIIFDPSQDNYENKILLRGPARVMYRGELSDELLHAS